MLKACGEVTAIGVGVAGTFPIALGFLVIASMAMGLQVPVRQAFIHRMAPSAQRATVVSFDSLVSGVGSVGGQAGLGIYADRQSYSAAYVVGGTVALASIPFLWASRRLRPAADAFAEVVTPEAGSCVPAGIPAISGVDGVAEDG